MPAKKRRRRPVPESRHGITRIDQPSTRTHGYFARLGWHRRRDGSYSPQYRAFFGDVSHGGKRKALRAAQQWVASVQALLTKHKGQRPAKKRARAASRRR